MKYGKNLGRDALLHALKFKNKTHFWKSSAMLTPFHVGIIWLKFGLAAFSALATLAA
ncbi:MAG: hypothetical protein AAF236_05305 [Verrucomicrobiota bacterium]